MLSSGPHSEGKKAVIRLEKKKEMKLKNMVGGKKDLMKAKREKRKQRRQIKLKVSKKKKNHKPIRERDTKERKGLQASSKHHKSKTNNKQEGVMKRKMR